MAPAYRQTGKPSEKWVLVLYASPARAAERMIMKIVAKAMTPAK